MHEKSCAAHEEPCADAIRIPDVINQVLGDDGTFPNNARLPLLAYRDAVRADDRDPAAVFEGLFARNGWGGSWRNGVYAFHHYHSTAHEVLGCYGGSAEVQLGGEGGITVSLQRGDVVIIPAGVAHKRLSSTSGFAVAGAYPRAQRPDMCYGRPEERPGADESIARVALPERDPVYGDRGPLIEHWHEGA